MDYKIHDDLKEGLRAHSEIAALLMERFGPPYNPHVKHHIRSAIREASKKVTPFKGGDSKLKAQYMSKAAERQIIFGNLAKLIVDHAVPVSYINDVVLKLEKPTVNHIVDAVTRLSRLTIITENEHLELRKKRLTKSMPKGWEYDESDEDNLFARYREAKIKIVKKSYREVVRSARQAVNSDVSS